jgi:hypothetical protein
VERELERREPEQRALQADGRERDTDLVEQLVAWKRRHFCCGPALHQLGEHRGRRLRDRAAAAGELDLVDRVTVFAEGDVDRDLVAAERVLPLGGGVGVLDQAVPARILVVIEDHLAVHLVELAHCARRLWALCRPSTSRSISSGIV